MIPHLSIHLYSTASNSQKQIRNLVFLSFTSIINYLTQIIKIITIFFILGIHDLLFSEICTDRNNTVYQFISYFGLSFLSSKEKDEARDVSVYQSIKSKER